MQGTAFENRKKLNITQLMTDGILTQGHSESQERKAICRWEEGAVNQNKRP